ncbi:uncharacterized protein EV154DRAFT_243368 [Mucor mucedo]|nr:uncharacterized protein EV154DRAFT_243368 [Mucor mucedo]KAI7890842.1 hypothetical protein EV154DRAFT_243368 [Mucor mucedo]
MSENDNTLIYTPMTITRTLSRPPSYVVNDAMLLDAEREQAHLEILHELGEYYHQREQGFLKVLLCRSSDTNYRDACQSCLLSQFQGVLMAFWITVLICLGALSVFTHLPQGAQALWIPLALYMILAFFLFKQRHKRAIRIDQLERQVLAERTRRRLNLLPTGHFFEIQYDNKDHTHPYRTLLKPPPIYTH